MAGLSRGDARRVVAEAAGVVRRLGCSRERGRDPSGESPDPSGEFWEPVGELLEPPSDFLDWRGESPGRGEQTRDRIREMAERLRARDGTPGSPGRKKGKCRVCDECTGRVDNFARLKYLSRGDP
jgi:hypothetical protein